MQETQNYLELVDRQPWNVSKKYSIPSRGKKDIMSSSQISTDRQTDKETDLVLEVTPSAVGHLKTITFKNSKYFPALSSFS